jgi:Spy/CpxP family protein refolding chaperone
MEGNMSQRTLLVLVCALFLFFSGAQCLAQNTPDQGASQGIADPEIKAKVQAKLQELATELNLTAEQENQIKPVLQDEFKQLKSVSYDASLTAEQKKTRATGIHDSTKSQINSFLTPDQQKKLAEMREKRKENLDK